MGDKFLSFFIIFSYMIRNNNYIMMLLSDAWLPHHFLPDADWAFWSVPARFVTALLAFFGL